MLFEAEKETLVAEAVIPSGSVKALLSLMTSIDIAVASFSLVSSSTIVIPAQISKGLTIPSFETTFLISLDLFN